MSDPITPDPSDDPLKQVAELAPGTAVAPAVGIAAIALNFALKYHDINTVQDGALYQQYKLEGKNMNPLHLDMVFETGMKIEMHLLAASDRISKIVIEAVVEAVNEDENEEGDPAPSDEPKP